MPPLPSQTEVLEHVRATVGECAQLPAAAVTDTMVLRQLPLLLDDDKLAFLAISLRRYVQSHNPDATVLTKDTRKDGQSVRALHVLLYTRITGELAQLT